MNNETSNSKDTSDVKMKVNKIYGLSAMQEGMLYHSIMQEGSHSYVQQILLDLEGEFEYKLFEACLNRIIEKYGILRTNFVYEKVKKPQQVEFASKNIKAYYEDLIDETKENQQSILENYLKEERIQGFDLKKGDLIKLSVFRLDSTVYKVIISNHHIILDGWSIGIITKELLQSYKILKSGEVLEKDTIPSYSEYINWLRGRDHEKSIAYWKTYLKEYEQLTSIPKLYKNHESAAYIYKAIDCHLNKNVTRYMEKIARENKVTLSTVFQVIWGLLLQKYNNSSDAIVGVIVSGRNPEVPQIDKMVGLFINIIPVRIQCTQNENFFDVLKKVNAHTLEARPYEYSSFAQIQATTELRQNLLDHIIEFENYPLEKVLFADKTQGFTINQVELIMESNYDLNVSVIPGEEIEICMRYNGATYSEELLQNIPRQLEYIVEQIMQNPSVSIKDLKITSEKELQTISAFNETETDFPYDRTLQEIFEQQVKVHSNETALIFEDKALTYEQLNVKANQLAHLLRAKGVGVNSRVAIILDRSFEMIISILAILKAGGVYIPIDPEMPKERMLTILEDAQTKIVMTQTKHINNLDEEVAPQDIVVLDDLECVVSGYNKENLVPVNASTDTAYIMYTSGSTGKPKGNLIMHYNISRVVKKTNYINITSKDRLLQLSNYSFDGSTFDIYGALLNGAKLILVAKNQLLDIAALSQIIIEKQVNIFFVTTALFNALVDVNIQCFKNVQKVLFGGERVSVSHVTKAFDYMGPNKLIHVYGPTESTTFTTYYPINYIDTRLGTIPIGKPIANTKVYIMDSNLNIQPIGAPGELCISGQGLAQGYLNRLELTNEKFVTNPANQEERIYRTGDLARWLPDGNIEFLDRLDTQVKLRGFRIELGEIETKLLEHPFIKEAVVLCKDNQEGQKFLYACVVAEEKLTVSTLREYLSQDLPDYMIPAYFIQLDEIPLNMNGKVDKKQLAQFEKFETLSVNVQYEAPQNETQQRLVEIWEEVLDVKSIGIQNNYFSQGGDSIKAIQIASRLQKFGLKMEIKDLFQHPTIKELSPYIKTKQTVVNQEVVEGEVPLTAIQKWFMAQKFAQQHHFNQSTMLYRKEGFDGTKVQEAFTQIVRHHDALRMQFLPTGQQMNRGIEGSLFDFKIEDLRNATDDYALIKEKAQEVQGSINIETGPLVKLCLFKTQKGDHLLIVIHHLVVDGISWRIILEDFARIYTQLMSNEPVTLEAKTNSFKTWAEQIQKYAQSEMVNRERSFWEKLCHQKVGVLPKDHSITTRYMRDMKECEITLSAQETTQLLKEVHQAYHTEINDILLTALAMTISAWTKAENVCINLEGHGREEIIDNVEINRTVGWFTSAYPVILTIDAAKEIGYQIKYNKDLMHRIPHHGIGYGILSYLSEKPLEKTIVPEVSFNYLGQFDQDIPKELFEISHYDQGKTIGEECARSFVLDMNSFIKDNQMSCIISYNSLEYDEETITALAQSYKLNLQKLLNHCTQKENVEYTPTDYTYHKLTIENLAEINRNIVACEENSAAKQPVEIEDIYPLTSMQEGMLYSLLMNEDSYSYFEQIVMDIVQPINIELLEESINAVIKKHELLRTCFKYREVEEPIQVVLKDRPIRIHFEDLSKQNENKQYIDDFKETQKKLGFDLEKEPLIKLTVFKINESMYKMIFSFHHIIMDGWCIGIIIKELFKKYQSLESNLVADIGVAYSYSEYIKWLEKQNKQEAKAYWQSYLEGYQEQVSVPKKKEIINQEVYDHQEYVFTLDEAMTQTLLDIARLNQVTLNSVFEGVWTILLKNYNGCEEVVFGNVVSGRPQAVRGAESIVGLFINTIPARIKCSDDLNFVDLIKMIQDQAIKSEKYGYYSLGEIQKLSELNSNLFDHIIVFENYPLEKALKGDNKEICGYKVGNIEVFEQTNYGFNITVMPGREMVIRLTYNANEYETSFVKLIEGHLKTVITLLKNNMRCSLKDMDIVTQLEREHLLHTLNPSATEFERDKTIDQLFEATVEKYPNHIAVIGEGYQLTYSELNAKANQLAAYLRKKGVGVDSLVGLMVDRSEEMIVAIMGILKAGGAYVPIGINYPTERIKNIIEDSGMHVFLTKKQYMDKETLGIEVTYLDAPLFDKEATQNLGLVRSAKSLAYVIYTSGSTGKPKGVMIEHSALVNRLTWMQKQYPIGIEDVILQKTPYTFDVSVWELIWWSLQGATVCMLAQDDEKNPDAILKAIRQYHVTVMHFVPSMLSSFLEYIECMKEDLTKLKSLRQVFASGEALLVKYVGQFNRLLGIPYDIALSNLYGPTEAAIDVTYYDCPKDEQLKSIPIGKPIDNIQIYILNENHLVPKGVVGELCIGGVGLARGYLNNKVLTDEKFVNNPFKEGERIYRTGDLARWQEDGNIEYLGRNDHQVKIRGFRIELGEIEYLLLKQKEIKQAAVVAQGESSGIKVLCAYIVENEPVDIEAIRTDLEKNLPEYMVPSYFIKLENLPLSANGKLDRKQLPVPNMQFEERKQIIMPRNEIEEALAHVWEDVLGISSISVTDSFMALGGDSIKAIQVVARLNKYNLKLDIKDIFKYSTIEAIAQHGIRKQERKNSQELVVGEVGLTPIQQWFFHKQIKAPNHWNQAFMLYRKQRFEEEKVKAVFEALMKQHDALRMIYKLEDNEVIQYNRGLEEENYWSLEVYDVCHEVDEESVILNLSNKVQQSLDIQQGQLIKLALFKAKDGDHLLIVIHHLIIDGVSWRILLEDFEVAYRQLINNEAIVLAPRTCSFKMWSEQLKEYAHKEELLAELNYWENVSNTHIEPLPVNALDQKQQVSYAKDNVDEKINLSKHETEQLLLKANKTYNTETNDLLLTALGLAIKEWSHQEKIAVFVEGHGREEIGEEIDVTRTIGWFTTLYPVVLSIGNTNELEYLIRHIKEDLRRIPKKGIGYGVLKYLSEVQKEKLTFKLEPEISFNYLGEFNNEMHTELFELSPYDTGKMIGDESVNPYRLNINIVILNGQLQIICTYNKNLYNKHTITTFLMNYKQRLLELVEYCITQYDKTQETHITPSDVGDENLSIEDLDFMSQFLEQL